MLLHCVRTSNRIELDIQHGGERLFNEFKQYLMECGIKHELTVLYTPQQNGIAERMNRSMMDLIRSLLLRREVPVRFRAEAVATAVYIRNRVSSRVYPQTQHHIKCGMVRSQV